MAITIDDFSKIWASTSPLTPYEFSESQYKEGWNFIGGTPPSRQMWDFLQKNNDEKLKYLLDNFDDYAKKTDLDSYLPLSGGTMTGAITLSNGKGVLRSYSDGTFLYAEESTLNTRLELHTNANGEGFRLVAGNGTQGASFIGNPDGTLTWDGQPLLPVGIVQAFAGSTTPAGWLLCDGSAVSRTTYANLFACIGTTYGAGNSSTTFNLPNLTDRFIQGNGTVGTVKNAGLPNITGYAVSSCLYLTDTVTDTSGGAFSNYGTNTLKSMGGLSRTDVQNQKTGIAIDASRSSSIYGNSTTVQPPALTMRYIIKY